MKRTIECTLIVLAALFFVQPLTAQDEEEVIKYTYASDKQFNRVQDFTGYTFIPNEVEEGEFGPELIGEGDVKILFTENIVYFKGVEGYSSININSKNPFNLGYEFEWMDVNNPSISGKLRIICDQQNFVQLIYINSRETPEYAFFMPLKSEYLLEQEAAYFTSKKDVEARAYPSLDGKAIYPYRMIEDLRTRVPEERVYIEDSIYLKFELEKMHYKKGELDKTYTIKKAKTMEYRFPGKPEIKFLIEIAVEEVNEKFKIYVNSRNQIEAIELRKSRFFLKPD